MVASHSIAQADCRQALAFGLDVFGSVDLEEYQLRVKDLAAALTSPDVISGILPMPEFLVRLLVFEWSSKNYQRILIPWTSISNIKTLQPYQLNYASHSDIMPHSPRLWGRLHRPG